MTHNDNERSSAMPDLFDRQIGLLHDLPDVVHTKPTTIRVVTTLVGNSQMYIVQTYRQIEKGDTVFLECVGKDGTVRLALPPQVADAISRQRDALGTKVRRKIGKASAQARKDRGELPGFMRKKQVSRG
jgi:hypothetical protein